MTPHSSSDDPGRYQPDDWAIRAARHDPVRRLGAWLATLGRLSSEELSRWQAEVDLEVRAAIDGAEKTPPPAAESVTEDVYASHPYRSIAPQR
jgi:TPP-dependent pyruvate/acetoin dehydrogenase alpha subunit